MVQTPKVKLLRSAPIFIRIFVRFVTFIILESCAGMIIETGKEKVMGNNKKRKPTDEGLKNYNPSNRDFERTEEQTDKVSGSEIEERKREQEKNEDK